ncbi:MAG: hypothetical protein WEB67_11325 [Acidimicrobiia bacterium]
MTYREKVTWRGGRELSIVRPTPPVEVVEVVGDTGLTVLSIRDPALIPTNIDDPNGTPLPLFEGDGFRLDLSRRTTAPMGFWHRNIDNDEVIICAQGGMIWETELGTVTLTAGDILLLPRGLAHRAIPPKNSQDENILIELKVRGDVRTVGPALAGPRTQDVNAGCDD